MRLRSTCCLIPLAAAVAGCDPTAGVTVHQRLAPAPSIECVHAALTASPMVTSAQPVEYSKALPGYSFGVVLHDSVAPFHAMPPFIRLLVPAHDSATLEVSVGYFGATTSRITPEMARQSAAAADRLVGAIRDACAPRAPAAATCLISGFGRSRPCAPTA